MATTHSTSASVCIHDALDHIYGEIEKMPVKIWVNPTEGQTVAWREARPGVVEVETKLFKGMLRHFGYEPATEEDE